MCMENYGVSHAKGYEQQSGKFAEAYKRGDFDRVMKAEAVPQEINQEPISNEPPVNQPFIPALKEDQQSPLWNPSSLAEPAELPVAQELPVVQETPVILSPISGKSDAQMGYSEAETKKALEGYEAKKSQDLAKMDTRQKNALARQIQPAKNKINELSKTIKQYADNPRLDSRVRNNYKAIREKAMAELSENQRILDKLNPNNDFKNGFKFVEIPTIKAGGI